MLRMRRAVFSLPALLTLVTGGCDILLGLDNPQPPPPSTTTTTTTTAAGGAGGGGEGGGTTSSTSSAGAGGQSCEEGETNACYDGPAGTVGVGLCKAGIQSCAGGAWGACIGAVLPGTETCATTQDEDCDAVECARWAFAFGDEGEQYPLDVAVDGDGFIYLLGAFEGVLDLGGTALLASGGLDLFIAKFDPLGNHVWSKQYANPSLADPPSGFLADLDVRSDGAIVFSLPFLGTIDLGSGPMSSDGFLSDVAVARLDPDGKTVWSKRFGGFETDKLAGIGFTPDGNILLSGTFQSTIDFGLGVWDTGGTIDGYLAKLTADSGDPIWGKQIGGAANQQIQAQAIDSAGSVVAWGIITGSTSICGKTLVPQAGTKDLFAARFEGETGECQWVNQYKGTGTFSATRGTVDSLGRATFAGLLDGSLNLGGGSVISAGPSGTFDVFLVQLHAPTGGYQWSKALQASSTTELVGTILANNQQDIVSVLQSPGTVSFGEGALESAGGEDVFFGVLKQSGAQLWARRFGDMAEQSNPHIALFPNGDIVLTAKASGNFAIGTTMVATKGADILLARLAP